MNQAQRHFWITIGPVITALIGAVALIMFLTTSEQPISKDAVIAELPDVIDTVSELPEPATHVDYHITAAPY